MSLNAAATEANSDPFSGSTRVAKSPDATPRAALPTVARGRRSRRRTAQMEASTPIKRGAAAMNKEFLALLRRSPRSGPSSRVTPTAPSTGPSV